MPGGAEGFAGERSLRVLSLLRVAPSSHGIAGGVRGALLQSERREGADAGEEKRRLENREAERIDRVENQNENPE